MTRAQLKAFFETGDTPTQSQFASLIDAMLNLTDDDYNDVPGLADALADLAALIPGSGGGGGGSGPFAISDVTGLQTALDGKSATGHGHVISDVTGLQTAIDEKAATSHSHTVADVTTLPEIIQGLETGKAEVSHRHVPGDMDGLIGLFLDPTDDAALITALASATFTDDLATISGWAQGRKYYANRIMYEAIADDTVARTVTRNVTVSTSTPSGGSSGDIWYQVAE
jgi:hypothetical protein